MENNEVTIKPTKFIIDLGIKATATNTDSNVTVPMKAIYLKRSSSRDGYNFLN